MLREELFGKSFTGLFSPSPQHWQQHIVVLEKTVYEFGREGGLLCLVYGGGQRETAAMLLVRLYNVLRRQMRPVQLRTDWAGTGELDIPAGHIIVAPFALPSILSIAAEEHVNRITGLQRGVRTGVTLVAAVSREDWPLVVEELPPIWKIKKYELPPISVSISRSIDNENERLKVFLNEARQEVSETFQYVLLAEMLGLAIPYRLLAAVMNLSEDDLEANIIDPWANLFAVAEQDAAPGLFVTATAGDVACKAWSDLPVSQDNAYIETMCVRLAEVANPAIKSERLLILGLLNRLADKGKREDGIAAVEVAANFEYWNRASGGDEARELIAWGRMFGRYCRFQAADKVLQYAVKRFPNNEYVYHAWLKNRVMWSERSQTVRNETDHLVQVSLQNYPNKPYFVHLAADFCRFKGNYREMRRIVDSLDIEEFAPECQAILLAQRLVAYRGENYKPNIIAAVQCKLDEVVRLSGPEVKAYVLHMEGDFQKKSGRYQNAEEKFLQVLSVIPNNLAALHSLAVLYGDLGYWTLARQYLSKLLEIDPSNVYGLHSYGKMCREQAELLAEIHSVGYNLNLPKNGNEYLLEAETIFRRVLRLDPENVHTRVELALTYMQTGDLPKAEATLSEGFKLQADNDYLKLTHAWLKFRLGKRQEAEAQMTLLAEKAGNHRAAVLGSKAKLYAETGRAVQAVELLYQAMESSRGLDSLKLLVEIGKNHFAADRDEAEEAFAEAEGLLGKTSAYIKMAHALMLYRTNEPGWREELMQVAKMGIILDWQGDS